MILLLGLALLVVKHTAHMSWNKPPTPVTTTVIYGTVSGGPYPNAGCTAKPKVDKCVVKNLTAGTYYFVAYATNSKGRNSGYSNQAVAIVP
jgi:hypothetical protein